MRSLATLRRALQGGQRERAVLAAEALLVERPAPQELLGAARMAAEAGAWWVAKDLLEDSLRERPYDADLRDELAELLEDMGALEEAGELRAGVRAPGPGHSATQGSPDEGAGAARESEVVYDPLHRIAQEPPGAGKSATVPALSGGSPQGLGAAEEPAMEADADTPWGDVADADLVRFHQRFQGRENVHARQWCTPDGKTGYSPVRQPLTPALLRAHFHGSVTLGVYPIRLDHTATFFALDLDITKRALEEAYGHRQRTERLRELVHVEGLRLRSALAALGVPALLFDSGYKGRHVWSFLAEPQPAALVYKVVLALARHLRPHAADLALEAFPRQASVKGEGLGNLIKLPLGIHLRTGRRAALLGEEGQPVATPWELIRATPTLQREQLLDLLDTLKREEPLAEAPQETREPGRRALPFPSPPPARPPFREEDLRREPALSALFGGCAVLRVLADKALTERRLRHDERLVLRHTLGHVERGNEATNYLFERCPEVPSDAYLGGPLRGSPMSCAKVRQRLPERTSQLPCNCAFLDAPDHYPTPVLHARGARSREAPRPLELDARFARWAAAQERQERVASELDAERRELIESLRALPDRSVRGTRGTWRLHDADGLCELRWDPDGPDEEVE